MAAPVGTVLPVHQLHGDLRRREQQASGQSRIAVPEHPRRVDVEPGAAVAALQNVFGGHLGRRLQAGDAKGNWRGLAAGRLERHVPPDAQPRNPLRHQQRAVCRAQGDSSVAAFRTVDREEPVRPARRIRVHAGRPDRHSRRHRKIFRRRLRSGLVVDRAVRRRRGQRAGGLRRSRGLRGQSVERQAPADLRRGAADSGPAEERLADCDAGAARSLQLSVVDRTAAAVWSDDGAAGGLRGEQQPARAVSEEHQSDLQPRDGRELRLHRCDTRGLSGLGRRQRVRVGGVVELSRAGNGVHQAPQPAVAGVGHLHAVDLQRREHVAGAVADAGAGSRRRVWTVDDGPAASRGVQRHLGGGLWLPGERAVLLRLGPALRDDLRRRRSAARAA